MRRGEDGACEQQRRGMEASVGGKGGQRGQSEERRGEIPRRVPRTAAFRQRSPSKDSSQVFSTTVPSSHSWRFESLPSRSRPSEPALPSSSELPQPGTPPAVVSRTPTEHRMSPPGMVRWGHWWGGASQDLEWGPQVGPESPAAALGVDPLPAPPQDDVDLDVDQQRDDEGHVEGDYGGVDHEGRVGDDALALLWRRESPRRASQHHAVEALSPS